MSQPSLIWRAVCKTCCRQTLCVTQIQWREYNTKEPRGNLICCHIQAFILSSLLVLSFINLWLVLIQISSAFPGYCVLWSSEKIIGKVGCWKRGVAFDWSLAFKIYYNLKKNPNNPVCHNSFSINSVYSNCHAKAIVKYSYVSLVLWSHEYTRTIWCWFGWRNSLILVS